ncbi:3-hydroxyacyl-CoA dehydrogenase [Aureimonas altamirensis]|uniref:3-hydroxyacyl-CoA dehydrogenase n=1 Tax=Aureimonas altamirensis TaxID=370622 RepID=UPI0030175421
MTTERIAIVGAGLVGQGWAVAFARAGHTVVVHDRTDLSHVRKLIEGTVAALVAEGLCDDADALLSRIGYEADMVRTLEGADYVQESVFERLDVKREVSLTIDRHLRPGAIVGSSTSGFPGSSFTAECGNRDRFLVVHPVNPPHLIPLVEIVPTPWTAPHISGQVRALMESIGQSPVSLDREIEGFVLNRLQGALLDEAFALLADGYASAEDIDRAVRDGLGLRWAFMGPFETIDLNAPEGLADYARRLGPMYADFAEQRGADRRWQEHAVAKAHAERRTAVPNETLPDRRAWRDTMLARMRRFREDNPHSR